MPGQARILVVEDDGVSRALLEEICRADGNDVEAVGSGEAAIARAGGGWDLVVSDVRLGDGPSGMDVLAAFQQRAPQTPVILLTAFGDVTGAMEAIQRGAHDYVSKPFNVEELSSTVRRALERQRQIEESREARKGQKSTVFKDIVGRSPAMLEVYKMVARVAPSKSTVLVIGESGTGKELVAREIHSHSPRARAPFVAINCSALSESLLESELFGHEKGAFTGAVAQKRGVFEEAVGGTLFLDEIGEISAKMQAQLLRVLQEGEVRRVGGSASIAVDVRVVAATNRDLEEEVRSGRFRDDLYFRINVVSIRLPPLRERREDIPLLVEHFLHKYASRAGRAEPGIGPDAAAALGRHGWPGNVRELENTLERALALSKDGFVTLQDLPRELAAAAQASVPTPGLIEDRPTLAELERRYIDLILRETGGNKKRAAEILGIDRRTLYRTLERESREGGRDRDAEGEGGGAGGFDEEG